MFTFHFNKDTEKNFSRFTIEVMAALKQWDFVSKQERLNVYLLQDKPIRESIQVYEVKDITQYIQENS